MENRITKRLNLYLRSLAVAKDKTKVRVLEGKIDALNFVLKTLNEV